MSSTAEEIAALDAFKEKLERHDWFYYFSDDGRVYNAGEAASKALVNETKNGPIEFKRAYNQAHAKRFNQECFTHSNGELKYPWEPPYPEASEGIFSKAEETRGDQTGGSPESQGL